MKRGSEVCSLIEVLKDKLSWILMVGSFLEGRGSFQNLLVLVNLQECIVAGRIPFSFGNVGYT